MKVTKEEKFKPITITLETKEEADLMWHLLNINYVQIKGYPYILPNPNIKSIMWRELNKYYEPKELKCK